ncbi:MAG: class I SAM-dependent methyltransferase, partial [Burkholderiales bacterium]
MLSNLFNALRGRSARQPAAGNSAPAGDASGEADQATALAQSHYLEARQMADEGRLEDALAACRAANRIDPHLHEARVLAAALRLPGPNYLEFLAHLHERLKPANYVEIGVSQGASFGLIRPGTPAIGVDPAPRVDFALSAGSRVVEATSDEFFASHDVCAELGGPVALAFIDGMHNFEYALRDFIQLERLAMRESTLLIHDCYPLDRETAARERSTRFWSGDIWRLVMVLKKYRPDLAVHTLALRPTGLGMVRRLDPTSTVLADNYAAIVEEFLALDYSVL